MGRGGCTLQPWCCRRGNRTPDALIEEKPAGLAWHYRAADPDHGMQQADDPRAHLQELFSPEVQDVRRLLKGLVELGRGRVDPGEVAGGAPRDAVDDHRMLAV
jgi:hypothetical protein